ncbi:MAG: HlyC/CorC family transporter [Bacteroidetes bacterium]|nr:HlyC/CorC family transporter [Bacteroidota bacterium]
MSDLFILFLLILINGFFSMAEIALVSSRKPRLEAQANKGDLRAKLALQLAQKPDSFLSTVQIGITIIGIFTGIFSGERIVDDVEAFLMKQQPISAFANELATAVVVIAVTFFSLVFGELVPKRLGLSNPEGIAKSVAGPMLLVSKFMHPFVWLLSRTSNVILKVFMVKTDESQVTEEEIKAIINEGTEHGAIEETEQEIIQRVFHLGDRNVTSLMTHRSDIIWFDLNDSENSIREKILKEPHSVYPVCDKSIDNIKGIVSIKDMYTTPDDIPFKDVMNNPLFVPETISPYQLLEKFKQSKIHTSFVVDEYGSLLGLVTLNDILEAIVGDLPELDLQDYEIKMREDGSYLVDAQIPFYDFLSHFEKADWMGEGDQEFDTLAGFILQQLERIPVTGDQFEWKGFSFEILDMDGRRIDKVQVTISDKIREELNDEA